MNDKDNKNSINENKKREARKPLTKLLSGTKNKKKKIFCLMWDGTPTFRLNIFGCLWDTEEGECNEKIVHS